MHIPANPNPGSFFTPEMPGQFGFAEIGPKKMIRATKKNKGRLGHFFEFFQPAGGRQPGIEKTHLPPDPGGTGLGGKKMGL
jgi:hypothetical protein